MLAIAVFAVAYFGREQVGAGVRDARDKADMGIVKQYPEVLLSMLSPEIADYDPDGRNLFKYYTPPPKRPTQDKTPKPPPITRNNPPIRNEPVAQRVNPTKVDRGPQVPNMGFDYLGYLGPKDNKIAVFAEGEELLLARIGDVIQKQFKLVDFGYETVVMGYTDDTFKDETKELAQVGR